MAKSELEQYKEHVVAQLGKLSPLLQSYALGDFSESIEIAEEEDEFTELLVGLTLMVDDVKNMIQEREDTIAKFRQAEAALRESESKYRTLVENIPQKIFTKDTNLVYVSCNEKFAHDLGITPEEYTGKMDYDFFPTELADKYRADDRRIMESGKTEDIEEKYIQDGREVWVHTIKTPLRDEEGNVIGILGIFWDITERRRAEEELAQRVQELETFNRLAVGRELRMIELKRQVNELSEQLGKEPPYDLSLLRE
jgi:PAS domain S-box-containing protein